MSQTNKLRSAFSVIMSLAVIHASILAFAVDADETAAPAAVYGDWQVVGPAGGDVRAVAIAPRDKNRLYISTLDGQIHTSADGGRSWRLLVNLNKPELILDQLFVDGN